jgi:hypothetical protein
VQLAPPVPHALCDGRAHRLPVQQPLAQEVASQTHLPPEQRWPLTHAGPVPHAQAAVAEQLSALVGLQATHAPPPVPHAPSERGVQLLPLQQLLGQEVALQTHAPATHCWPLAHAGPEPQRHEPPPQLSAVIALQATHAAPAVPHALVDGETQVEPVQQPPGHEVALQPAHAPPVQLWPGGHVWHALPPAPHEFVAVPGRQLLPEQQPLAHEAGVHTQLPPTQAWPLTHGGPLPHAHAPLGEQPSASALGHETHAPPPEPHAPSDGTTQLAPLQQPLAHEVASHTHAPPAQRWPLAH